MTERASPIWAAVSGVRMGDHVFHKYMPGMWKGIVVDVYGNDRKVRWETTPPRETWVSQSALRADGEHADKTEER